MPTEKIFFENLTIAAGNFRREGIHFGIEKGTCGVLMGKTAYGKTTLIETLCGLRAAIAGRIWIDSKDVTHYSPRNRQIGYVPQDVALFASMTVFENIAFALRIRHWKEPLLTNRVKELAEKLGITSLLERSTKGLSGGEAKRVALGRALAFHPEILCLDEPLNALDTETHQELCSAIRHILQVEKVTAFLITHNPQEAELLGDQIIRW